MSNLHRKMRKFAVNCQYFALHLKKFTLAKKNLHGRRPWRPWQIWGMHFSWERTQNSERNMKQNSVEIRHICIVNRIHDKSLNVFESEFKAICCVLLVDNGLLHFQFPKKLFLVIDICSVCADSFRTLVLWLSSEDEIINNGENVKSCPLILTLLWKSRNQP